MYRDVQIVLACHIIVVSNAVHFVLCYRSTVTSSVFLSFFLSFYFPYFFLATTIFLIVSTSSYCTGRSISNHVCQRKRVRSNRPATELSPFHNPDYYMVIVMLPLNCLLQSDSVLPLCLCLCLCLCLAQTALLLALRATFTFKPSAD